MLTPGRGGRTCTVCYATSCHVLWVMLPHAMYCGSCYLMPCTVCYATSCHVLWVMLPHAMYCGSCYLMRVMLTACNANCCCFDRCKFLLHSTRTYVPHRPSSTYIALHREIHAFSQHTHALALNTAHTCTGTQHSTHMHWHSTQHTHALAFSQHTLALNTAHTCTGTQHSTHMHWHSHSTHMHWHSTQHTDTRHTCTGILTAHTCTGTQHSTQIHDTHTLVHSHSCTSEWHHCFVTVYDVLHTDDVILFITNDNLFCSSFM